MRGASLLSLCGLLAGLAGSPAGAADAAPPQAVAPGIYVIPGAPDAPSAANSGRVANSGIIVGQQGVIVIGTGTSAADGERILAVIARLTAKPVLLAINAYAAPEHVLGNGAFARRGIPILAHRETGRYMAAHCAACLGNLKEQVGAAALADTRPQGPDWLIDGATTLVIGGRRLEILHDGPAQQPGSIAVFDPASGVLFAGGLAAFAAVPDTRDADLAGWRKALDKLQALSPSLVVPALGPPGGAARLGETRDYLADLENETRRAQAAGMSLFAASASVTLPRYAEWAMYARNHRRNVHFQFLRQEALDFAP